MLFHLRFVYYHSPQPQLMVSGVSGSVPQKNNTDHIIKTSVAVLSAHQVSKSNILAPSANGPLISKWRSFAETYKDVQQNFIRTIYGKAKARLRNEQNTSDSLLEDLRNNEAWAASKNFSDHLEDIRDALDGGNQKEKMMVPYQRDLPFFAEDGLNKLRNLMIIAVNNSEISEYISDELLKEACFSQLTDFKTRSWRINSRNVNHFSDDTNTTELQKKFDEFWVGPSVEDEVIGATKAILLMQCITDYAFEETELKSLNLKKYYEQTLDEYSRLRADSGTTQHHLEIIKRIEYLKWGPKEYQRDPEIIEIAMNRLHGAGVIALRGWGGVGKTALATRMIFDAAKNQSFDRYITSSTKVGSAQKEKNIHQSDGPNLIKSDKNTTIFDTLLSKDRKISGSIRRLCLQIIRSADGDTRLHDDSTVQTLITTAIKCMKKYKMLVCIDNFEDIEEPENLYLSDVKQEYLLEESQNFKIFFDAWTREYQALLKNNSEEIYSQVIVTTRSRGLGAAPYDVPLLTEKENFDLFLFKIRTRIEVRNEKNIAQILPQETIVTIDQSKNEVNKRFAEWYYVDGDTSIEGMHPMNSISAAVDVSENNLEHILSIIDDWNPKGVKANSIAKYCSSKVFRSLPSLDKAIITELIMRNSQFTSNDIVAVANDLLTSNAKLGEAFGHDEGHQFLMTYHNDRNWFVNSPNNAHKYRWKADIYVHMLQVEEVENKLKIRFELKSQEKHEQRGSPSYDPTARKALYEWINDHDKDFNFSDELTHRRLFALLTPLLKEKNLKEPQIASAYIMIFKDELLKGKNKIFDGHPPTKTLIQIATDYNKNKTKPAAGKSQKTTDRGRGGNLVSSPKGLALKSGLPAFVDYVTTIQDEFNRTLKDNNSYGICLRLYSDMIKTFEKYYKAELFPLESVINEYKFVLNELMDLPESEVHDVGAYNQMVQDFIADVSNHIGIVPKGTGHSFNLTSEYLDVCKLIVRAGNEMFEWSVGGHEKTCGSIFWAAMHTLANIEPGDPYENIALDMLEQHYSNGRDLTRSVLNVNLFRIYHNRITQSKKQLFWTTSELMKPSGSQFGTLGKIVFMDVTETTVPANVEIVYQEENEMEQRQMIQDNCKYFRVVNHTAHRLYVIPILEENGEPIEFEDLVGFEEVKKAVTKIINSNDLSRNPLSWSEMKQLISSQLDYDPWLSLSHYDSERNAVLEFMRLIDREDLTLETIQEHIYLKIGNFTPGDIAKLKKFGYEAKFPSDYSQITASRERRKGRKGHSWPRNPVMMARILHEFISKSDNDTSITFQQMKNRIKNKLGETDGEVRQNVIDDCFNIMDEGYDPHWLQRPINFKHKVYKDSSALISALEKRAHYRCDNFNVFKDKPKARKLVSFYLENVRNEYDKIFKK